MFRKYSEKLHVRAQLLVLDNLTFHEKVVSIFNMATETERRFIDFFLIGIIVERAAFGKNFDIEVPGLFCYQCKIF